jgi:hypothetical protein
MVIEKVIFTIDDNPHYKGFWKSISRHYKTRLGFDCKLFIIGNNVDINEYDSTYGEIEVVPLVEGVPSIIQALIGKFYYTLTEPNTTWKIGDLDLYPLQKNHFVEKIKDIDDDKYVHLHSHAYGENWRDTVYGLAGYYHVAKGKVFERELKFTDKTFSDVVHEIYNGNRWGIKFYENNASEVSKKASPHWGWFCCEEMYTGEMLRTSTNLIEIKAEETEGIYKGIYRRIDRSNLNYIEDDLINGKYIDFHSPRPYEDHSEFIENLIKQPNDFN